MGAVSELSYVAAGGCIGHLFSASYIEEKVAAMNKLRIEVYKLQGLPAKTAASYAFSYDVIHLGCSKY